MKGLQPVRNASTIYLAVKHGCLCQESRTMRDGYDPIEVVNRSTGEAFFKYIKAWAGVEAMVTDIQFRSEVFDGVPYISWRVFLQADGPPMILELSLNSNAGDRFMRCCENIDWTKPVEFRAWQERESKKTAFMIAQDDKNVPQLYTKDHPGDCPPARQRFDKTWDFEAQKEFLYQRMIEVVIPRVHAANGTKPEAPIAPDADPFAKTETRAEPPAEQWQNRQLGDDPFARPKPPQEAPARPQGSAIGTAGPITDATFQLLAREAQKRADLDFNELATKLYQRPGVRDLTEGQAIALLKYIEML